MIFIMRKQYVVVFDTSVILRKHLLFVENGRQCTFLINQDGRHREQLLFTARCRYKSMSLVNYVLLINIIVPSKLGNARFVEGLRVSCTFTLVSICVMWVQLLLNRWL